MITLTLLGYVLPMLICVGLSKFGKNYKTFLLSLIPIFNVAMLLFSVGAAVVLQYKRSMEPSVKNWVEGNSPAPKKTRKKRTPKTQSLAVPNTSPDLL